MTNWDGLSRLPDVFSPPTHCVALALAEIGVYAPDKVYKRSDIAELSSATRCNVFLSLRNQVYQVSTSPTQRSVLLVSDGDDHIARAVLFDFPAGEQIFPHADLAEPFSLARLNKAKREAKEKALLTNVQTRHETKANVDQNLEAASRLSRSMQHPREDISKALTELKTMLSASQKTLKAGKLTERNVAEGEMFSALQIPTLPRKASFRAAPLPQGTVYSAAPFNLKEILSNVSMPEQPLSTLDSCVDAVRDFIQGQYQFPPRVGGDHSAIIVSKATTVFSLTAMTAGASIYLVYNTRSPHFGFIVYERTVAGAWNILGSVGADTDPEAFSTCVYALASRIKASAVQVTGGTVNIIAGSTVEAGFVAQPLSLVPGKMAAIANGKAPEMEPLLDRNIILADFPCAREVSSTCSRSDFDLSNGSITTINNKTFTPNRHPLRVNDTNVYTVNTSGPSDATQFRSGGFVAGFPNLALAANTPTTIWNLKGSTGFNVVPLSGDIRLDCKVSGSAGLLCTQLSVDFTISYHDGTSVSGKICQHPTAPSTNFSFNGFFSTLGNGAFANKAGLIITDVLLTARADSGPATLSTGVSGADIFVHIDFLSNPANDSFGVVAFHNLTSASSISAELTSQAEAIINPASQNATFVTPTTSLPMNSEVFGLFINGLLKDQGIMAGTLQGGDFEAASFGKKLKKFLGKVWKVARPAVMLGGRKLIDIGATALNGIAPGAGTAVSAIANNLLPKAAGFGNVSRPPARNTNEIVFAFPAVRTDPSDIAVELVSVVSGDSDEADFLALAGLPPVRPEQPFVGTSGTLAMLCASLYLQGWSVVRTGRVDGAPACVLTGDVRDLVFASDFSTEHVQFTLYPVDKVNDKVFALSSAGINLRGLSLQGWYDGRSFVAPDHLRLFGPDIVFVATAGEIFAAEDGRAVPTLRVSALRHLH